MCRVLRAGFALGLVVLSACAPLSPRKLPRLPEGPPPAFAIRGWLDIRTPGGRGGIFHLSWRADSREQVLLVTAPLGTAGFLIRGRPGEWCVRTSRRGIRRLPHLHRFLRRWIGADVPLAAAWYWLFSLPWPDLLSYVRFDREGRVRLLRQGGWTIRYRHYTTLAHRPLADRFRLEHDGLVMTIVVDRWTLWNRSSTGPTATRPVPSPRHRPSAPVAKPMSHAPREHGCTSGA